MSYSDNFYLAVANQTNTAVNSPVVAGTNNNSVNPALTGLSCRTCQDNYCYQDAVAYSDELFGTPQCGYTNEGACDVGGNSADNSCRYNGDLQDWQYATLPCSAGLFIGGVMPVCATVDANICTLYDPDYPTDVTKSYTKYIYNTLNTPCTYNTPSTGTGSTCNTPIPDSYDSFVSWNNAKDQANEASAGRYINCNYNKRTFENNVDIIKSYYSNFIDPSSKNYATGNGTIPNSKTNANVQNQSNYNQIMQDFSQGISTDPDALCPLYTIYPYNAIQPSKCSRFVATGEEASWVSAWTTGSQISGSNPPVSAYSDNAKIAYCSDQANFNSPECQCINRSTVDPNYIALQQIVNVTPNCWYAACQDSSKYLITSDISAPICTSTVCQNVSVNIANSGGVITDNELQTISCTVDNSSTTDGTGIFGGNLNIPIWVWIILAIIFIIIIIAIGVLLFRKNKKEE